MASASSFSAPKSFPICQPKMQKKSDPVLFNQLKLKPLAARQLLLNRPLQVQRITHTTTRPLPNFTVTEEISKTVPCREFSSMHSHVERAKLAENLPEIKTSAKVPKKGVNFENPLNLDFAALDEFQRRQIGAREAEKQSRFEKTRRIMETKKLRMEEPKKILQKERDEKFKLPAFFDVVEEGIDGSGGWETKTEENKAGSPSRSSSLQCTAISLIDKPKNKRAIQLHYQHKREKLRQRLIAEKAESEKRLKEAQESKMKEEENFIFRLAEDESRSPSQADFIDPDKVKYASIHLSSRMSKMEQLPSDIPCGQRVGTRVVLRNFKDRRYSEPRGRGDLKAAEGDGDEKRESCKDTKVEKPKPKVKLLSSLKAFRDANDKNLRLFPNIYSKVQKKPTRIPHVDSPIRNYIFESDLRLKQRQCKLKVEKKEVIDASEAKKRNARMKFMGISAEVGVNQSADTQIESEALKTYVTSEDVKKMNEIKLMPTIPVLNGCQSEDEQAEEEDQVKTFVNAEPCGGKDPKMHRIDMSLPWIQSEIDATRVKLQYDSEDLALDSENLHDYDSHVQRDKKRISKENQSERKQRFNDLIAAKLQQTTNVKESEFKSEESKSEMEQQPSTSTLSSVGTNFTNDSGSFVVLVGEKIHKNQIGTADIQNKSLMTVEPQPSPTTQPFFNGNLQVMRQLMKPPDRFHTHNTRSRANLRERVRVESDDEKIIFGHKSQMAIDIDASYVQEFHNERAQTSFRFKPISEVAKLRKSFRKRLEAFWKEEQLLLAHKQQEDTAQELKKIAKTVSDYERYLEEHKERAHHATMRKLQETKNFYIATDKLRVEQEELVSQVEPLRMKIFKLGHEFLQRVQWQSFQYMLMPLDWRLQHDHLHRTPAGQLEDFRTSIQQRETRKLWDRNCTSVEGIISHIENDFERSENLTTFANCEEFLSRYESLKAESLKSLEKFSFAALMLSEVEQKFAVFSQQKDECFKVIMDRANDLAADIEKSAKRPHREWKLAEPQLSSTLAGAVEVFHKQFSSKSDIGSERLTTVEKFTSIEKKALGLFDALETIPADLVRQLEKEIRQERKRKLRVAEKAYKIELNADGFMKQMERLLAKPPKKEKRVGKLPISVLAKNPPRELKKPPPPLTDLEQEYARVLPELAAESTIEDVREQIKRIQHQSIPIYIDRMLESMGHAVAQLSPEDEERIIADEEERMKHKDLLPEVRKRAKFWEILREKEKSENIAKTLYIYEQIKKRN